MDDIVNRIKFRFAKPADVDFIVTCIIEAEKSGTNTINSCRIFNLEEQEWRDILRKILLLDIPDYEFSLSGFLIAELDEMPVSSQGAWFEGKKGLSGIVIKTSMLMEYIPAENFNFDQKKTEFIKTLSMKRDKQKIQLEYSYTVPELRRRGIHTRLLFEIMHRVYAEFPSDIKVQTTFFRGNRNTFNEFTKLGFKIIQEKKVNDPEVMNIFAYDTKIMMESSRGEIIQIIKELYEPVSNIKLLETP